MDNEEDMIYVLPNSRNFGCALYSDSDLYKNGASSVPGCGGGFVEYALTVGTQKPRYLTGEEQKAACGECIRMILSYCEMLQQEAAALMSVQLITH